MYFKVLLDVVTVVREYLARWGYIKEICKYLECISLLMPFLEGYAKILELPDNIYWIIDTVMILTLEPVSVQGASWACSPGRKSFFSVAELTFCYFMKLEQLTNAMFKECKEGTHTVVKYECL